MNGGIVGMNAWGTPRDNFRGNLFYGEQVGFEAVAGWLPALRHLADAVNRLLCLDKLDVEAYCKKETSQQRLKILMTHSVDIFIQSHQAWQNGIPMMPRSANDKEYFPQDWFIDRLQASGIPYLTQGRNSYPDFWVGDPSHQPKEGFEIKSLSFANGRPARKDYDSNSSVPSGKKDGHDVFLVFFLYTGSGADPRLVHSLVIAHTDLINADHQIAGDHYNAGIPGFGSYADGYIRNRKMYRFPHPYRLHPSCIGKCRLITPAKWNLNDYRLMKVDSLQRTIARDKVQKYTIDLQHQQTPKITTNPYPNAGQVHNFDVWEAV